MVDSHRLLCVFLFLRQTHRRKGQRLYSRGVEGAVGGCCGEEKIMVRTHSPTSNIHCYHGGAAVAASSLPRRCPDYGCQNNITGTRQNFCTPRGTKILTDRV